MKVTIAAGLAAWCAVGVAAGVIWSAVMWLGKYQEDEWDWQECLPEDEEVSSYGTKAQ